MTTTGSEPRARVDDEHCPAVAVEAGVAQLRQLLQAGERDRGQAEHGESRALPRARSRGKASMQYALSRTQTPLTKRNWMSSPLAAPSARRRFCSRRMHGKRVSRAKSHRE